MTVNDSHDLKDSSRFIAGVLTGQQAVHGGNVCIPRESRSIGRIEQRGGDSARDGPRGTRLFTLTDPQATKRRCPILRLSARLSA